MKLPSWLLRTIKKTAREGFAAAMALAILLTPRVAAAQKKTSPQKTPGSNQVQAAQAVTATVEEKSELPKERAGGQQEGIKVHGDWTIVIRNQDGTVASRHEFKNALANFAILPQILAHGGGVGQWEVDVDGNFPARPCATGPLPSGISIPIACSLFETTGSPTFGSLTVTASATNLTVRGSVQAANAAQLGTVFTKFNLCLPPQTPSATCTNGGGTVGFTGKDISSLNIQVAPNQTIDVTVVISFS